VSKNNDRATCCNARPVRCRLILRVTTHLRTRGYSGRVSTPVRDGLWRHAEPLRVTTDKVGRYCSVQTNA
jgi:hypothetical protein